MTSVTNVTVNGTVNGSVTYICLSSPSNDALVVFLVWNLIMVCSVIACGVALSSTRNVDLKRDTSIDSEYATSKDNRILAFWGWELFFLMLVNMIAVANAAPACGKSTAALTAVNNYLVLSTIASFMLFIQVSAPHPIVLYNLLWPLIWLNILLNQFFALIPSGIILANTGSSAFSVIVFVYDVLSWFAKLIFFVYKIFAHTYHQNDTTSLFPEQDLKGHMTGLFNSWDFKDCVLSCFFGPGWILLLLAPKWPYNLVPNHMIVKEITRSVVTQAIETRA